ncbi:MAG: hypothetical protein K2Y37_20365 [Pirellulales bacterium]|nr:hypothetical protein [Pirellulales bacterium]
MTFAGRFAAFLLRPAGLLTAALMFALAVGPVAGIEPPEVHQVEANPDEFVGRPMTLTGRFSAFGAGKLRLVDSRIDFRVFPEAGAVRRAPTHVELTGRLSRTDKGLVFDVATFTPLAPETKRFAERRASLSAPQFDALYDLSRWARQRGQWYGDEALLELAWGNYREAFRWEEDEVARVGDSTRLLALAARGDSLGLESAETLRIRHRALWLKVGMLPPAQPAARRELAAQVRELLPGSEEPLPADSAAQWANYEQRPIEMYDGLSAADRRRAHRAFWAWLIGGAFAEEARQPKARLAALVDEARAMLPDRPAIVAELERKLWTERSSRPEHMPRTELDRARAAWARLGDEAKVKELTAAWLSGQFERLAPGDAEARLRLAIDYLDLADDREMAATLAREAAELSPEMGEATELLERLGFVRVEGNWKPVAEVRTATVGGGSSVVQPGDSETIAREKLRPPDRIARVAGRGWIVEQWIYDGPARFSVYLHRTPATGVAVVRRVVGN